MRPTLTLHIAALAVCVAALACSEDSGPSDGNDTSAAGATDTGPGQDAVSGTDAGIDAIKAKPVITGIDRLLGPDHALFDCSKKGVPNERLTSVPLGCVLDPACKDPLVVGHRGAGGEFGQIAPENSLASIRAAMWIGQDGVELDVRATSDDKLVLMHDSTVDRTTLSKGKISEMTLAEAKKLVLRGGNGNDVVYKGDFSCERVPELAEAFALLKGRLFVDLDMKTSRVDLVVAAIQAAGVKDQVFISVSDPSLAVKARKIDPDVRVQVRPDSEKELADILAKFDKRAPEVIEVPQGEVKKLAPKAHAAKAKVFTNSWSVDALERLIRHQAKGYLGIWAEGCDIVQTEFPAAALQALGRVAK